MSVNLGLSVINEVPCLGHQALRVRTCQHLPLVIPAGSFVPSGTFSGSRMLTALSRITGQLIALAPCLLSPRLNVPRRPQAAPWSPHPNPPLFTRILQSCELADNRKCHLLCDSFLPWSCDPCRSLPVSLPLLRNCTPPYRSG